MTDGVKNGPRIAIIGAGPSGCFLAGSLRRSLPEARILVIDRLPTPFGLVRYGVAADHQSTKAITRQFDRIFTREGVEFAGNVRVTGAPDAGAVTLEELQRRTDAIVLATGLAADRSLGVPGDALPGVYGSGAVTRVLNSHPDEETAQGLVAQLGDRVAIVGMGNVAVDLIRFLAKRAADFEGSDVNDTALDAYMGAPASRVDVFSRSSISQAKCDAQMIRELAKIEGLRAVLHEDVDAAVEEIEDRTQRSRVEALRGLAEETAAVDARIEVHLHFGASPVEVLGGDRVEGLRMAGRGGNTADFAVDSVVSAIGFQADAHSLPLDEAAERPGSDSGRIRPGLYRVGWFRRGPRGTIPENRADAVAVAAEIVADIESGAIGSAETGGAPILPEAVAAEAVSYEQWLSIDRYEQEHAADGRTRAKLPSTARMLEIARGSAESAEATPTNYESHPKRGTL